MHIMEGFSVDAPGVIKGFGEHAVVYGRTAIAVAIDIYATASVSAESGETMELRLLDFEESARFSLSELRHIYEEYRSRTSIEEYIKNSSRIDAHALPYAVVAARLVNETGMERLPSVVEIHSEIPMQSGCASSAACSTAFAVALARFSGVRPEDHKMVDIAREGERIVHRSEGAGKVDVIASYYGGYVSTADGGKRVPIEVRLNMVLVDTGPKKSTAETVGNVRRLYQQDREATEKRLEEIERCAVEGLKALASGDLVKGGEYMYRDHEILRELGVSSEGLDKAVGIAKKNGAYGAKLSGGGGGGIAVVLCRETGGMVKAMEEAGFKAYVAEVSLSGARDFLE